jgi:hypothetical protein
VDIWLETPFEHGRHEERLRKLDLPTDEISPMANDES